jgi:cytoskeletal protein CcmA (bactofilin family)
MWKKDEVTPDHAASPTSAPARQSHGSGGATGRSRATIGTSITIRGEVTGDEDLLIEGRVEGSVDLKQHSVTVGSEGQVKAAITGRVVTVEGSVEGDVHAEEVVVLRSTARVQGDITAPRVVLEDGATFRGAVDMGDQGSRVRTGTQNSAGQSTSSGAKAPAGAAVSGKVAEVSP